MQSDTSFRNRTADVPQEKAKHTPGPWEIGGVSMNDGSISIRHAAHRIIIACVTNAASFGELVVQGTAFTQFANADLIAAAPDLLESLDPDTLDAIADEIDCPEHSARAHGLRGIAKRQRAAIAKAVHKPRA